MEQIIINNRAIGLGNPPFIIAEMSGNHNHSLERALEIVEAAAKAGAHALKLQTYRADTMTLNLNHGEFCINQSDSLWEGYSLYNLYQEAYTPWEWHKPIFDRGKELGMIVFSTPFDASALEFLEELNVPCYKIASFEVTDLPLISKVAKTGKPIIISTGMATIAEIDEAVRTAKEAGCRDLILLKCTSTYPASPKDTNILTIPHMQQLFQCQVGLSDHTLGVGVAVASVALGATVVEKHFTLSRASGGVDAAFSLEPDEMKILVDETKRAWQALGEVTYGPTVKEKDSLSLRRSLYITEDIQKGECLTKYNLRAIRPGLGLSPKYYDLLIGKKVNQDVKKGTPLSWGLI
ncbi:pseudaminic acid synthase [Desulforamulus aquiferis]|uniref:Pseudaminic acid synthase n=1 Tax=Desulforamulus aquiferis TaxID=1397668 RepID=A0AAW7ZG17_9FIRM|nr:pseudaminic acid synthase [Desulforamulus aquiferis]MDO7788274.1 pseudaminic acid synthase [Desulforamulus aquiferis]